MKKIKIDIDYAPYVEPPFEYCLLCGGGVPAHYAAIDKKAGVPVLCFECGHPADRPIGYPRFRSARDWSLDTHQTYGTAGAVLWLMEKEIEQRKHNQ